MLFYEPLFLFFFGPAVYLAYLWFGGSRHRRVIVLLLASIIFYAWSEPVFIFVVFASVALDLYIARKIVPLAPGEEVVERVAAANDADLLIRSQPALRAVTDKRSQWLALGIAANLTVLMYYKYFGFLAFNVDALMRALTLPGLRIPDIALPVGVSFIVFEKITYLVDVYRGVTAPAREPFLFALYVFFFPKLLAGPIIKYHDIAGQLETIRHAHINDFVSGFSRFMLGVVKKLLVADVMANGADLIFSRNVETMGFADAWTGALFFTFQIYFDFSGYSDMAIGLARIFGFRLLENFNMPYIATSVTDFWRRWHISLTSWIREYLYFPLGGNRRGETRTYFNLWICFFASGAWHGAAWTFIIWGTYNGFFLLLDRLFLIKLLKRLPVSLANIVTMFIIMVGWTLFRATSLQQAGAMIALMAQPTALGSAPAIIPPEYSCMALFAAGVCVAQRLAANAGADWTGLARRYAFVANALLATLFVAAIAKGLAAPFKPFLYFRF